MVDTARNPATLRAEIERTRDQLAQTIDSIADQAAPKKLAEGYMEQAVARGGQAAQLASEQAKEGIQTLRDAAPGLLDSEAVHRAVGIADTYRPIVRANRTVILAGLGALVVLLLTWRSARK